MAKETSVFYKLPIEEMRGKLATKQDGIMYAGQEQGQNTLSIGEGSHAATNFEKYIVLTKRRGKNRFYVKSRTTVTNTMATNFRRASIALASALADYVIPYVKTELSYKQLREAFEYDGNGKTLREYIVAACLRAFERGDQIISVLSAPLDDSGVRTNVEIINNPVYANSVLATTIKASALDPSTPYFTQLATRAAIVQEYIRYFAAVMNCVQAPITVIDTKTGRKYETMFVATALDQPLVSIGDGSVQSDTYRIQFAGSPEAPMLDSITIYNRTRDIAITGKPYLDEEKTQEVNMLEVSFQGARTMYI